QLPRGASIDRHADFFAVGVLTIHIGEGEKRDRPVVGEEGTARVIRKWIQPCRWRQLGHLCGIPRSKVEGKDLNGVFVVAARTAVGVRDCTAVGTEYEERARLITSVQRP